MTELIELICEKCYCRYKTEFVKGLVCACPNCDGVHRRVDSVRGGYQFTACVTCGVRHNGGRPGNAARYRYVHFYQNKWWDEHVKEGT